MSLPVLVSTSAECIAAPSSPLQSIFSHTPVSSSSTTCTTAITCVTSFSTCTTSVVSSASYSGSNNVATTPSRGVALGTCRKRRCMTTSCGNGNDYSLGSRRSSRIASNGYSTALPASPITTVPTSTIPPSLISTVLTRTVPTSSPLSSGSILVSSTGIPPSSLSGHSATSGLSRSSSAVHSSRPSHQLDAVVGS